MPILDPNLQFYLVEETLNNDGGYYKGFFLRYLRVASRNINKNFNTLKASNIFKFDIKNSIKLINSLFHCKLNGKKIEDPMILDYYQFLYDQIISSSKFNIKDGKSVLGRYFKQKTDPSKIFFRPQLPFPKNHSWYFSDCPIAILSINFDNNTIFINKKENDFFQLIKLETDLLQAAGLTLILCFNYSVDLSEYLIDLIRRNQFTEIHCNFKNAKDTEHFYVNYFQNGKPKFNSFKGFIYIYSPYSSKTIHHFKKLQKQSRFYVFYFSSEFKKLLEPTKFEKIEKFKYFKTGFKYDSPKELKVRLSNVPLYNKKENDQSFIPSKVSFCYVSLEDFINWTDERIEIVLFNVKDGNYVKYINFNDLHSIKRDLYANDTLLLADIDNSTLEKIDRLEKEIKMIKNKKNKRNSINIKGRDKEIKLAAYNYARINSSHKTFSLHRPQIFTVFDANKILFSNNSLSRNQLQKQKKRLENELVSKANKNSKDFIHPDLQNILSNESLRDEFNKVLKKNDTANPKRYSKLITKLNKEEDIKNEINKIEHDLNCDDNILKGVIYQVETGEGKTCIISVIAAVLALKGKKVHIASSNIKLSNRDYMNSFDYFDSLEIKSAVFLHQNELPIYKANNKVEFDRYDKCYNITNDKKRFNYYNASEFNNVSKMNFAVCGLDSENNIPQDCPNIIFSTIVNFEIFYLKMLEICPGYIDDYFENCVLLIDEADSILIDEIANGTIVSKSMKSNLKEVLLYVYENKKNDVSAKETYKQVKQKWPKIVDLTSKDIERMYHEIDIVNEPEFVNGKKYYIEKYTVKNEKKKSKLVKNTLNFVKNAAKYAGKIACKIGKAVIKEITNYDEEEDNDENEEEDIENDDNSDDENVDDEEKEEDKKDDDYESETTFHYIIPFDYDHKGILEPNKEFSGFIQQFIAIKESIENKVENMIIKDVSMSYLYVSHPIFVNLYSKVCGFTGTIGKKNEAGIFRKEYGLKTKKVPRNRPNKRVELPMILCTTINERNKKIVSEILDFHAKGNPVLVIFEDLNEITKVKRLLKLENIGAINIFDGKNSNISAEKMAGKKSAISLGTNVCGRGTDIKLEDKKKPLHVIISYYTSNSRVIKQAHGRTARQGQKGTSRIICLKNEFLFPRVFSDNGIKETVEEFRIKNQLQSEYIELFKITRKWIFLNNIGKLNFNDEQIKTMRDIRINVNRIVAYNYEFPLQMSVTTFLKIQAQKIVSLINCPNTKYTWKLFQQYIREMILESWSLMINEADRRFFEKNENKKYQKDYDELSDISKSLNKTMYMKKNERYKKKFSEVYKKYENHLKRNIDTLLTSLLDYLPLTGKNNNGNKCFIDETFMHIINKVVKENQNKILGLYSKNSNAYIKFGNNTFVGCQFGFRPFALLSESGARIVQKNYKQMNYIKDPELKYLKRIPKNHKLCLLSITEKIDDLFNEICKKINEFIGKNTLLRFFLRRTLCGCEFGICFNFEYEVKEFDDINCLFDKEPLLLFTINVRSLVPILAGILIIALVYIAYLIKEIIECIAALPEKKAKDVVIKGLIICCELVGKDIADKIFDKVCEFLGAKLLSQIEKIRKFNEEYADIILKIKNCFTSTVGKKVNKFSSFLSDKIKVKVGWMNKIQRLISPERIMKISLYLLLCLASFIITFNKRNDALPNAKNDAKEYNKHINGSDMKDAIHDLENKNKSNVLNENTEINIIKKPIDFDRFDKSNSKKYLYQFLRFDLSQKIIKLSDMEEMKDKISNKLIQLLDIIAFDVRAFKHKENNRVKCLRFEYHEMKDIFYQQVRILAMNELPSILNLIGYSIHNKKMYLFVEKKGQYTLESFMKRIANNELKMNETHKLIIAYGLAKTLEILHYHKVILRNLNSSNIAIDSNFRPYITDFGLSLQTDLKPSYLLCNQTIETMKKKFVAPELAKGNIIVPDTMDPKDMDDDLIEKYMINQNSLKFDVFSYGAVLHVLFTGETIPDDENYEFPRGIDPLWIRLILDCLNDDSNSRPDFISICETILKISTKKTIDKNKFNEYKKLFMKYEPFQNQ